MTQNLMTAQTLPSTLAYAGENFFETHPFETHHCVTGSMRRIYAYNGCDISEEMLLGLGEGVGFIYWHQKGQQPFIGGRATPKPSFEEIAGKRTGVAISTHTTSSTKTAENALIQLLEKGTPVMLQVDMGLLPYFDFHGQEYHFGGHVVVACGYDSTAHEVLIADRDLALHHIPLADLANARGSTYKPFPPKNKWYTVDFSNFHQPTPAAIYEAIANQARFMLNPPISNMGVQGIRKAGQLVPQWNHSLDDEGLKWALFNTYIFISAVGGTGGGAFRHMFSRFLSEAGQSTGNTKLTDLSSTFHEIAVQWDDLGCTFKDASVSESPAEWLPRFSAPFATIAALEESAWSTRADNIA